MHITCFGVTLTMPYFPQVQILCRQLKGLYGYVSEVSGPFNIVYTMDGQMDVLFKEELRVIPPTPQSRLAPSSEQQGQQNQREVDGEGDGQSRHGQQGEKHEEVEQLSEVAHLT